MLDSTPEVDFHFHNFTADPFFNFTLHPGITQCFEIMVVDDEVAELHYEYFRYKIGMFTPDQEDCDSGRLIIEDNDGMI